VLLGRAQELPLVYVFEWFQRFPIVVVSKTAANITTPADLVGRHVGLPGFFGASYVGYMGLLSANGIDPADVNAEEINFTQIESLTTDRVEAVVGYANNEPVQLAGMGEAVNVLNVADYIDMVANGIITNEATIAENPELVQGFVRALRRGLSDTLAAPDEAYETSKKYVEGLDDSRKGVLTASLPIWQADTLGFSDAASWENMQNVMLEMGFLEAPLPDLSAVFTNEFVEGDE
jgi:NitT/TauT family transport system substrate-binding protein